MTAAKVDRPNGRGEVLRRFLKTERVGEDQCRSFILGMQVYWTQKRQILRVVKIAVHMKSKGQVRKKRQPGR